MISTVCMFMLISGSKKSCLLKTVPSQLTSTVNLWPFPSPIVLAPDKCQSNAIVSIIAAVRQIFTRSVYFFRIFNFAIFNWWAFLG